MAITTREIICIAITVLSVAACAIWYWGASSAFEQDRTTYVPYQAPWLERYQTLVGGVFATFGGALAIVGGFYAAHSQIRAAEIQRDLALTQMEIRQRYRTSEQRESDQAEAIKQRSQVQQWAASLLGKVEASLGLLRERSSAFPPELSYAEKMSLRSTLKIDESEIIASEKFNSNYLSQIEHENIKTIKYRFEAGRGAISRLGGSNSFSAINAKQTAIGELIDHFRIIEGAVRQLKEMDLNPSHLTPPPPESAPKG